MRLGLRSGPGDDHMVLALFLAALLHGLLILGVRFTSPPESDRPLPTLEVLLVPSGENEEANLDASYMADRNQAGTGTTRDRVHTSLPEPMPAERANLPPGETAEPAQDASRPGASANVAARALDARRSFAGDSATRAIASAPIDIHPLPQIGAGAVASSEDLTLRGRPVTDERLLADTRESQIARYLDGWKRRIEQVGTLNFPNEARRRSLSGNPVLEVAIGANGQLQEVIVRRTSGYSELDHAAMNIVRLASPFDPFPPALRERYPSLRFAYEWQFIGGRLGDGALLGDDG